ncbi:2-amino-4-hydroxy-6-hydroxymethyldihydropteridine diphosphokinase [Spongiibacter sp. IMCC21906]|nr:2-amino-4-hydroxy-6-hydroxymethyldihydropteridine diphosphokinase [Spongiibacter sp. IMCC21906]
MWALLLNEALGRAASIVAEVFLGLGSNRDRYRHLSLGLDALSDRFGSLGLSRVFESESVGFEGSLFLNMVVSLSTELSVGELSQCIREIEVDHGRIPNAAKYSPRTLDIDLLLYDDVVGVVDGVELPRGEVLNNAFVLWPLSELSPEREHPVAKRPYRQLWQNYSSSQKLWPVDFQWQGRCISTP